jgi:hypothetical protein
MFICYEFLAVVFKTLFMHIVLTLCLISFMIKYGSVLAFKWHQKHVIILHNLCQKSQRDEISPVVIKLLSKSSIWLTITPKVSELCSFFVDRQTKRQEPTSIFWVYSHFYESINNRLPPMLLLCRFLIFLLRIGRVHFSLTLTTITEWVDLFRDVWFTCVGWPLNSDRVAFGVCVSGFWFFC